MGHGTVRIHQIEGLFGHETFLEVRGHSKAHGPKAKLGQC